MPSTTVIDVTSNLDVLDITERGELILGFRLKLRLNTRSLRERCSISQNDVRPVCLCKYLVIAIGAMEAFQDTTTPCRRGLV